MTTYAIGDIQGCYEELIALLDVINFDSKKDNLWFVGDLVNRGPNSIKVLRFIKNISDRCCIVLGNHDLHLLAVAYGFQPLRHCDTFQDVLKAPDKETLLTWLRNQKLLHYDANLNFMMVHAGLPPQWTLNNARNYAKEIENILRSNQYKPLLENMYGDKPDIWREDLKDIDRYRFIINAFTRMRYCDTQGRLNLKEKGSVGSQSHELLPWFKVPNRKHLNCKIVFGHWASLNGITNEPNIFTIDTGCSWGNKLTALCLETQERFFSQNNKF